jgi:hypothetical protein
MNRARDPQAAGGRVIDWSGYGLVLGLSLFLFWPVLNGSSELGYRDSATLYQPLFQWTRDRLLGGEIPRWCAQDNWGAPLVADLTSSVFYPGKLVLLLPAVRFSVLFGIYVLLHVWLAIFAARWCGHRAGLSPIAAWLTGITYGFSGSVMFQSCNVVFLVSAAWLPAALGCVLQYRKTRHRRWLVAVAVVMSMMVLGGDPQMAFHVIVIAGLLWCLPCRADAVRPPAAVRRITQVSGALLSIALMTAALTAIQVFPAIPWSQQSERSVRGNDRSIYRAWTHGPVEKGEKATEDPVNRFARPKPGTHQDAIYQFSLAPWTLVDLIWPNVGGKQDPWSARLAGADRLWTGSLYCGLFTLLLATAHLVTLPSRHPDRALIPVMGLFLLASFGWYGAGWLIHELNLMRGGSGTGHLLGEPTGGIYWLLEMLVPGYYRFRYPAKLFVIAALIICLTGGRGYDRLTGRAAFRTARFRGLFRRETIVVAAMTCMAVLLLAIHGLAGQPLFPLIDASVSRLIRDSLLHTAIVLGIGAALLIWRRRIAWIGRYFDVWWLLLCTGEILLATAWTVQLAPVTEWNQPANASAFEQTTWRSPRLDDPPLASVDPAKRRIQEQRSLYPKYHLHTGRRLVGSFNSLQPLDVTVLLNHPDFQTVLGEMSVDSSMEPSDDETDFRIVARPHRPRIYLAERWVRLEPVDETSVSEVTRRTSEVISLLQGNRGGDADGHEIVTVECQAATLEGLRGVEETASITLLEHAHERQTIRVTNRRPALLVIADYFDANWTASLIEGDRLTRLPRVRVNRLLTGVPIPPGDYRVQLVYRDMRLQRGAWLSGLAWLALVPGWLYFRRRRPSPN